MTLPAGALTATGATLNASINPNGYDTSAWFQWGTATNYGNLTAATDLGGQTNDLTLSVQLAGLTPGLTYHFCVAATNSNGAVYGNDQSFTTVSNAAAATLEIQAFIDGRDQLLIRSNTLQWLHYDWAAVGRWNGNNEPTLISTVVGSQTMMSNVAWVPTWPEPPPAEIRYPANSSVFTELTPPLPADKDQPITLNPITARGSVSMVEYPTASNGFALLVEFNDDALGGAAWYDVSLSFGRAPTVECQPSSQTAEQGSTVGWLARTCGSPPLSYQWSLNGANVPIDLTNNRLILTNVQFTQSGVCMVVLSNVFGAVTSSPALLSVIVPVGHRPVPRLLGTGAAGSLLNVDAANSLNPAPDWTTLTSISLTSTSQYYFDLTLPLPAQRFYRVWQMGTSGVIPSLDLYFATAITVTGNVNHSVRLDYINRFGPTDAWVTLDTVTLTNMSQLYFDTSSWRQPPRLYRLVPLP